MMKGQQNGPKPPSLFPLQLGPGRYWSALVERDGKVALHGTGAQQAADGERPEKEMGMGQGKPARGWSLKGKRKGQRKGQRGLHEGRLRQSWWSTWETTKEGRIDGAERKEPVSCEL